MALSLKLLLRKILKIFTAIKISSKNAIIGQICYPHPVDYLCLFFPPISITGMGSFCGCLL
jgi:hypothetical protein